MTWNILMGGEDRMDAILAVVRDIAPDVAVLQECLGWEDGARLRAVADAMGAAHAHLGQSRPRGSGKRYHVAVSSRLPVTFLKNHSDPAHLGHGILEVEVGGAQLLATHFDAHGEDARLREAAYVNATARLSGAALLVGDLNALSRRDPYPSDLADRLRRAQVDKYGHPPRFDTIDALEAAGWVDLRPAAEWVTARRDRGGVRIGYRTDYVFASPGMASRCGGAWVRPCEGASDHEPVVVEINAP